MLTILLLALTLTLCQSQSLIEHGIHAHTDMVKGHCPKLNDTIGTRKKDFDPKKLLGLWKTIYMSKNRTEGMDCLTMKLQEFKGANESQVQVLTGHQLVDHENDASRFEDFELDGVFYDEAFLTFSDPDNKALAVVQNKKEVNVPHEERINRDMKELTDEQKADMTREEIDLYEEHALMLEEMEYEELYQLANSNHYHENHWEILETDYERYFISYMCHELEEEINSADQTPEDVEDLKTKNSDVSYDEEFFTQPYHFVDAAIHVRNMTTIHAAQYRQFMLRLQKMVPDHDFYESRHDMIVHGYKCPEEEEDLFKMPFVHSYETMIKNIDDVDGSVHFHQTYELVENIYKNMTIDNGDDDKEKHVDL